MAAAKVSDGLERDLWLVLNRRSSQAGSFARRNAGGIHAGSVSDAGGLHESFGKRRQSVGDSGSGEYLYEAWQSAIRGVELFPTGKIPGLVKYLDRRGINVHEAVNGSLDGVRGVMTLPRNPTKLNVRHELSHLLDFRKYGDDYYKLFTPAKREQMVLERLKNNRIGIN